MIFFRLKKDGDFDYSEAGMTLIEMMIASAIMMVLSLGMATFITNSRRATKAIEVKSNITNLSSNVSALASQPGSVSSSLNVME